MSYREVTDLDLPFEDRAAKAGMERLAAQLWLAFDVLVALEHAESVIARRFGDTKLAADLVGDRLRRLRSRLLRCRIRAESLIGPIEVKEATEAQTAIGRLLDMDSSV